MNFYLTVDGNAFELRVCLDRSCAHDPMFVGFILEGQEKKASNTEIISTYIESNFERMCFGFITVKNIPYRVNIMDDVRYRLIESGRINPFNLVGRDSNSIHRLLTEIADTLGL